jgi:hypothetical protein
MSKHLLAAGVPGDNQKPGQPASTAFSPFPTINWTKRNRSTAIFVKAKKDELQSPIHYANTITTVQL